MNIELESCEIEKYTSFKTVLEKLMTKIKENFKPTKDEQRVAKEIYKKF